MRKRSTGFLAAALVVSLIGVACAGQDGGSAGQSGEKEPLLIGLSISLTGMFSQEGKGQKKGYEAWASVVNENGGLLGRKVELLIRDDRSDPAAMTSIYERLITVDNVDMVLAPFSSLLTIPASEVAEKYEMLFVEGAAIAPEVFNRGLKFLFYADNSLTDGYGVGFADFILSLPEDQKPETAAYPSVDDPFAQPVVESIRKKLEADGIETVYQELYPPETVDLSPVAAKIAETGADIVAAGTTFQDGVNLIRGMKEIGYQPEAFFSSGAPATAPEFKQALGGAVEGVFGPISWTVDFPTPGNEEFVDAYSELFGGPPDGEDAAQSYSAGEVLEAAVKAVGSIEDQSALADWLRDNTVETIQGPVSWDETGAPASIEGLTILQYQEGEIEVVAGAAPDYLTSEPIYPKPTW